MRESVLSMLCKCRNCGQLTYNKDQYCNLCDPMEEDDEDTSTSETD